MKSVGMHCTAMLFFINKGINIVDTNNHSSFFTPRALVPLVGRTLYSLLFTLHSSLFSLHSSLFQEVPHVR